jgi:hypothetical protein
MFYQCPKCLWIHELDPGDVRLPPWCKKCGVDVKEDEYLPVAQSEVPPAPAPTADGGGMTQITGTGRKPWLDRPAGTKGPTKIVGRDQGQW